MKKIERKRELNFKLNLTTNIFQTELKKAENIPVMLLTSNKEHSDASQGSMCKIPSHILDPR